MSRLPRVTARQMLRALRHDGWGVVSVGGSHYQLTHPTKQGKVTVPVHSGTLAPGTILSILTQAGLTADDLRALL